MADGTIVAGTATSDTPAGGGDTTPPDTPTDFAAAYADPFVASRIDLTWTNPAEAGDYRINYRTDGTDPTASDDASATVLVDWTAYTENTAGSDSATSLTNGLRYRFALWHRDATSNISDGAHTQLVALKQITLEDPADGSTGIQRDAYLRWATDTGEADDGFPVHYRIEVSTSEASETDFVDNKVLTISSLDDGVTGFEYEQTSGVWVALPASGLAYADLGKDVRYRLSLSASGHYYWRVSAQQPSG
jgi:hypothetical protein